MTYYNLFLDDIRVPNDCRLYKVPGMPNDNWIYSDMKWVIVKNYNEFIKTISDKFINDEFPSTISFDHDLADVDDEKSGLICVKFNEKTGHDCAKWLLNFCIENDIEMPKCWVHSMNTIGNLNIRRTIEDWNRWKNKLK